MRLASAALALMAACLLAQAPIGMGPGGKVDAFDWWAATPSGCTQTATFPAIRCVGSSISGDSYYFSAWMPDASQLTVTTGLPIVGTINDYSSGTCNGNVGVLQLAAWSWSNRNAASIAEINCLPGYGTSSGATNTPTGWVGHCTTGDSGSCSWKTREPFSVGGVLYLPIERQIGSGSPSTHDALIIKSTDGGKTWRNPHTVAISGSALTNGDPPAYGDAAAIMWPGVPSGSFHNWLPVKYGQDGSLPTVGGDCSPQTYQCLIASDGSVARVLLTDLPSLDVTKWQYVSALDVNHKPTWTSTFTSRTPVLTFASGVDSDIQRPRGILGGPTYLKEFGSYVMGGFRYAPGNEIAFIVAPSVFGPWRQIGQVDGFIGFNAFSLGLGYNVISASPPHVQATVVADYKVHNGAGTPTFQLFDFVLGPQVGGVGDAPAYLDTGTGRANSGWRFTSGEEPGAFNRKGLIWAFDFMDHGGSTSGGYPFIHDVANNGAVLYPCYTDGATVCGVMIKGANLLSNGIQVSDGYQAHLESNISDINVGTTSGNLNAPPAMQGNGTFTVAGVFRIDGDSFGQTLWGTGNTSPGNASIALTGSLNVLTRILSVDWGTGNRYKMQSAFALTTGNWYYIETVVTAGTPDPTVNLWVGNSGTLTDVMAGVTRALTGGSPTRTPNVTAAPFVIGGPSSGGHVARTSYGALFLFSRALPKQESIVLYRALKAKMAERGITVQ